MNYHCIETPNFALTRQVTNHFPPLINDRLGFANYRAAFHQEIILTEKDLREVSAAHPRRLFTFSATSTARSADSTGIEFSMVNREKVPEEIQFTAHGKECTMLGTILS